MLKCLCLVTLVLILVPAACRTQEQPSLGLVAVASSGIGELELLDLITGHKVGSLAAGTRPREVAIHAETGLVAVTDYGVPDVPSVGITLFDARKLVAQRTFSFRRFPRLHGVQFFPDGTKLAVAAEERGAVLVIDLASGTLRNVIPTTQRRPRLLAVDRNGQRAFVSSTEDGTVAVLDLRANRVLRVVPVCKGLDGITLSSDDKELWVTCGFSDSIAVLDTDRLLVDETLPCAEWPTRLVVSAREDGDWVIVSNARSGDLAVFSRRIRREVMRIPLEFTPDERRTRLFDPDLQPVPIGVAIDAETDRGFVSCSNTDLITVVGLREGKVLARFPAGDRPEGIAVGRVK